MALPANVVYSGYADIFGTVNILAVGIVTVGADDAPGLQRVVILKPDSRPLFYMTLKADLRMVIRMYDGCSPASTGFHMKAARTVTVFTSRTIRLCVRVKMPMGGISEIPGPFIVAGGTRFRAHVFGTRDHGSGPDDAVLSRT
jgi:hypothetical protein